MYNTDIFSDSPTAPLSSQLPSYWSVSSSQTCPTFMSYLCHDLCFQPFPSFETSFFLPKQPSTHI